VEHSFSSLTRTLGSTRRFKHFQGAGPTVIFEFERPTIFWPISLYSQARLYVLMARTWWGADRARDLIPR